MTALLHRSLLSQAAAFHPTGGNREDGDTATHTALFRTGTSGRRAQAREGEPPKAINRLAPLQRFLPQKMRQSSPSATVRSAAQLAPRYAHYTALQTAECPAPAIRCWMDGGREEKRKETRALHAPLDRADHFFLRLIHLLGTVACAACWQSSPSQVPSNPMDVAQVKPILPPAPPRHVSRRMLKHLAFLHGTIHTTYSGVCTRVFRKRMSWTDCDEISRPSTDQHRARETPFVRVGFRLLMLSLHFPIPFIW